MYNGNVNDLNQQFLGKNIIQYSQSLMNNNDEGSDPNSHCSIVGLIGILVQIGLGVLSFSVLILKRHFQNPKRPWKIWRFDTTKQVISQLLAHFINLTISLALTQQDPSSDTCLWYFITNIFDNTAGVFICVFSLRLFERVFFKKRKYHLISGHYYEIKQNQRREDIGVQNRQIEQKIELAPPIIVINYKAWIFQLLIWNSIVIVSKFVLFAMEFILSSFLDIASKFLLGWIQAYPNLELVMVIVVVPVIMNGFAFWVQDNFLKKRQIPHNEQTPNIEIQLQDHSEKHDQLQRQQLQLQKKETDENQTTVQKQTNNSGNVQE